MKNTTFAATSKWTAFARQLLVAAALAGAILGAMVVGAGTASANSTPWAPWTPHTGPDYASITGARVGAPSEQQVSSYGGSHKHLFVEQQLYGPGVISVPQVDTTVHQSR